MSIHIRPYQESDSEELLQCVVELQEYEEALDRWAAPAEKIAVALRDEILTNLDKGDSFVYVAEDAGQVIAYVAVYPQLESEDSDEIPHKYALISDLAVRTTHRGKGIGRQLIEYAENLLREQQVQVVRIQALANNEAAVNLYRKTGFRDRVVTLEKYLDDAQESGGS